MPTCMYIGGSVWTCQHIYGEDRKRQSKHILCVYTICMCACMSINDWSSVSHLWHGHHAGFYLIKLWLWGENMSPTESQVDLSFYSKCQICTKSLKVQKEANFLMG